MRKPNNLITIGLIFNALFLISAVFHILPEFIEGFLAGSGISLIFIGFIAEKRGLSKFSARKVHVVRRRIIK